MIASTRSARWASRSRCRASRSSCVLVGGGYGAAPLASLAEGLRARGCAVHTVLGAATNDRLFGVLEAKRISDSLEVTTDDGSAGRAGHRLRRPARRPDADAAARWSTPADRWGCWPPWPASPATHGAHSQCAVEETMACGIGVCMTCVLPVIGADGVTRMVRSCVEGPVFRGDAVRWADVGTVPADALRRTGRERAPMTAREDGSGCDRTRTRSTCRPRWPGCPLASPILTASGCAAAGRELDQFVDVTTLGAVVTKSIMLVPRSGRRDAAHGRDAERHAELDRPAGAGDRALPRARPAVAAPPRRPGGGLDRRRHRSRSTRSWRTGCAASRASPRSR